MNEVDCDLQWMQQALALAERAGAEDEVPVGALVVMDNQCVGQGWNRPIATHDPSAHAEIVALRDAGRRLGNYRLTGATLYVTLEPCMMCVGAISHARIGELVFGATDPGRGAICSALEVASMDFLNHRFSWRQSTEADRCSRILKEFFVSRRSG